MLGFSLNIFGQRVCGSVLNMSELQQTDPVRYQRIMDLERQTSALLRSVNNIPQDTIIIPVVVHVVYKNSTENVSDAQINAQIQILNDDFQRLNADAVNTPVAFQSVAGSTKFKFMLAKLDPNGNPTSGITRTPTNKPGFSLYTDDVKYRSAGGHDAWNALWYLNIWVCNLSYPWGLMGYAQYPDQLDTKPYTDGVVISYLYFGKDNLFDPDYDKGRTTTHEVGHWLNLYHIWGDEDNCTATDFVDDTPNQFLDTSGCPSFPKTDKCTPSSPGIMFMNYMDYSFDACMNIFTKGQVDRMLALFDTQTGIRRDMLINAHCLTNPPVNFTGAISTPIIVSADTTVTNICGDINVQYVTVTNGATLTMKAARNIDIQDMVVINNSSLILEAGNEVTIIKDFEVELGSEFEIIIP